MIMALGHRMDEASGTQTPLLRIWHTVGYTEWSCRRGCLVQHRPLKQTDALVNIVGKIVVFLRVQVVLTTAHGLVV